MRLIPVQFAEDATTTCLCWHLTRTDGFEIGLTDHDRALSIDGLIFEPGGALMSGSFTTSRDLRPSRADASGALSSETISEADLIAGKWDGARVDVMRVDWTAPDEHVLIWSGRLSEVTHVEAGFSVELLSLKADLERPVGRIFSRLCDAVLGDARCGVDPLGRTCDQRFETCRDDFQNSGNFRGFPHMPGPDAILTGPAASGNTGGRR